MQTMAQSTGKELVYITEEEMANLQNHNKSKKKATIPKKFENMELSGAYVNSEDIQNSNKHSIQTQTDFVCNDVNSEKIIIGDASTESIKIHNLQLNVRSSELAITKKFKSCKNQQENGSSDGAKALNTDEEEKSPNFISNNNNLSLNKISEITSLVNVELTRGLSSRLDSWDSETESIRHKTHPCDKTETNTYLNMLPIELQNEEIVAKIQKIDSNEVSSVTDCPNFGKNHDLGSIDNSYLVMERQGSYLKPNEAVDLRQSNDRLDSEEVIDRQGQHHHYDDVDNETDRSVQNVSRYKCRRMKLFIILFFFHFLTIGSFAIYISFKDSTGQTTPIAGFQADGVKSELIAFSVQLYWYRPHPNLNYTRVVYDNVLLNIGSSYNKSDGIFYCRTSGIYIFSVFVKASVGYNDISHVMNLIIINKHFSSPVVRFADSISLFLKLYAGDKIWVENPDLIIQHCVFSGHIINDQY